MALDLGINRMSGQRLNLGDSRPGTLLPFDPGFSGQTRPGTALPFDQGGFGGNQSIAPQNNMMDLLRQLFGRINDGQQPSGAPTLATDKAVSEPKDPNPIIKPDQFKAWADALGLAVRPRKSITGGVSGKFDIEGITNVGNVRRSDFIRAFEEKQRDFRRQQTDPLNAQRATDVANQVFGQRDLLNQTAQSNELEQIRNDLQAEKLAFDITGRLLNG